jgi:hypothetical protein
MKIKSRNEVLNDIIRDAKKFPKGWKATFAKDDTSFSHNYYIFNPDIGVYHLKEYHKNPFHIKGLGAKIARHIDDDIEEALLRNTSDFGIVQENIQKILRNIERGIPPQKIFDAALQGKDLGLSIPVRGKASASKDTFTHLQTVLSSKQKSLDSKFEKMMVDDGVYTSYE